MVWQGVPYPLKNSDVILSLALKSIPKIVVDTPFSWETVLSGAIAGLIPAVIAYLAMNQNFKLANHQNKLQESVEFTRVFRAAAAELLTDIVLLASAFEQWHISGLRELALSGKRIQTPTEVSAAERAAEKSKNNLLLLIEPDSEGAEIVQLIANMQDKLRAYLIHEKVSQEHRDEFNKATSDFIFGCHKYLDGKGLNKKSV